MRKTDLRPAASLLGDAFGRPELLTRLEAQLVWRRWESCVGAQLAAKSFPEKFERGTLWVSVTTAVWVQELRMRQEAILERLNTIAGKELFKGLRFAVRPLPKRATETEKELPPDPEPIELCVVNEELDAPARKALGKLKAMGRKRK